MSSPVGLSRATTSKRVMPLRILNAEPRGYSGEARQLLEALGTVAECDADRDGFLRMLPEFDVAILRLRFQVDREVFAAAPRLKAVVTATTGLDHIDLEAARAHQVDVLSLRGEAEFLRSVTATAEHTWALLLSLLRRIPQAFDSVCRGEWNRDAFRGHDLQGGRLALVGLGRIGELVAGYGHAFGMKVHAFDPHRSDWVDGVQRHERLEELLAVAEVLSLHVPLTKETHAMIGAGELALLPRTAVVINTSRGDVLDHDALLTALERHTLAGAALDVVPGERSSTGVCRRLTEHARDNSGLLLTPHIGGATIESMAKTEVFMARKLTRWWETRAREP